MGDGASPLRRAKLGRLKRQWQCQTEYAVLTGSEPCLTPRVFNYGRPCLIHCVERLGSGVGAPHTPNAQRPTPNAHVNRLPILALLLVAACRSDPIFSDMSDSTYVQTMVALRKLPVGTVDSASRARQTDSVLKAFGLTAAQVESTSVRLSNDPARAAEIWRAIENARTSPP